MLVVVDILLLKKAKKEEKICTQSGGILRNANKGSILFTCVGIIFVLFFSLSLSLIPPDTKCKCIPHTHVIYIYI